MSNRIRHILFFDGTGNNFESDTNVYRLYRSTLKGWHGDVRQMPRYWEGVGVQRLETICGGVFGRFLWQNIKEGYEWLALSHCPGDEVHIFGFSRGAFTAMGLAGLLAWRGLPKEKEYVPDDVLESHLELYRSATQQSREQEAPDSMPLAQLNALSEGEKKKLSDLDKEALEKFRSVPIKFVGVFDTVRAAGLEVGRWIGNNLPVDVSPDELNTSRGTLALRYTRHLPPNVEQGFHALAVDEHRAAFHARVWIIPRMQEQMPEARLVEQRWFIGAHANVGGGYPDNPLQLIPLRWMQTKAEEAGIKFEEQVEVEPDAYRGRIVDSYAEFFGSAVSRKRFYRPIYVGQEAAHETERQTIDPTVLERIVTVEDYYPENVKDCLIELSKAKALPDSINEKLLQQCLDKFARPAK